ncbi:hypothetical protein [Paenibacillus sp. S02]|uniref:hypothetical protein n=1 Tax=Paenibacillus sp. S02 TaxID=2823904 RepID=UPI001C64C78C|nr:hypothetical protein [Paenibacillus sp. S02]
MYVRQENGLQDAPALHKMLSKVKIGDFIYIKSLTGQSSKALIIKAVGIVTDDRVEEHNGLGLGVSMKWIWQGEKKLDLTEQMYKNNVFINTLYEEFNRDIQTLILQKVFDLPGSQFVVLRDDLQKCRTLVIR